MFSTSTSFITPFPALNRREVILRRNGSFSKLFRNTHATKRRKVSQCVLVLGGTSGVGLETVQLIRSRGKVANVASRRTGHDLNNANILIDLLSRNNSSTTVGVMVGAGRGEKISMSEEISLYDSVVHALCHKSLGGLVDGVVIVTRQLVVKEVYEMLSNNASFPWVILRPGPLDIHGCNQTSTKIVTGAKRQPEILVTPDLRCNGFVSRKAVATVAADLLLGVVPIQSIKQQVLGVFDRNRMITIPDNAPVIAAHVWGDIQT